MTLDSKLVIGLIGVKSSPATLSKTVNSGTKKRFFFHHILSGLVGIGDNEGATFIEPTPYRTSVIPGTEVPQR